MKNLIRHIAVIVAISLVSQGLFAICYSNFEFNESSPLSVEFVNLSTSQDEGTVHYYWDFGDGNSSYETNPSHLYSSPGIYNVSLTIITSNLCYNSKSIDIHLGIPQNSPFCFLEIDFTTINAGAPNYNNGVASVFGYSDVPCCYYAFWSNGDEGETITNLEPGTYCVTLTDGINCYGTNCVTIGYNNNCMASFLIDSTTFSHLDGAYRFVNNSQGEQHNFLWDFGDGTTSESYNPLHVYADTGTYNVCLTINTHYDCVNTLCKTLHVDYISPLTANLYGIVNAGDALLPEGIAILYEYANSKYTAKDFTIFENGNYCFDSLPKDILYLTQVIPYFDLNEVYFPKYSPTYFNNSTYWQQSSFINLYTDTIYHTQLYSYNDIYLNDGVISGKITYQNTVSYEEEIFQRDWFEMAEETPGNARNIVVLLKNSDHVLLDFRLTDGNGNFNFGDLEYGGYYLSVEKPGLPSDEICIEISENNPDDAANDFIILENTISPVGTIKSVHTADIYPNPATDKFYIFSDFNDSYVKITDCNGVAKMNQSIVRGNNCIIVDFLSPGVYIVELVSPDKSFRTKLIKQ